jgi:hypothetical protein
VIHFSSSQKYVADSNMVKLYLVVAEETLDSSLLPVPPLLHTQDMLNKKASVYELEPVFVNALIRMIEMMAETQHGEFTMHCKQGNHDTIVELSGHTSLRFYIDRKKLEEIQAIHACICYKYATWLLEQAKNKADSR